MFFFCIQYTTTHVSHLIPKMPFQTWRKISSVGKITIDLI